MISKEDMEEALRNDPGNPLFADLADEFRKEGNFSKAMEICLAGLSSAENNLKGKLVLARIYYQQGYLPFAVRELRELCELRPESQRLRRLLELLSPQTHPGHPKEHQSTGAAQEATTEEEAKTLAEAEFDFDDLDFEETP